MPAQNSNHILPLSNEQDMWGVSIIVPSKARKVRGFAHTGTDVISRVVVDGPRSRKHQTLEKEG